MKNSMHLDNPKYPFPDKHPAIKPSLAKSEACNSNPGGKGDKISANAAMKQKRHLQGPGTAT